MNLPEADWGNLLQSSHQGLEVAPRGNGLTNSELRESPQTRDAPKPMLPGAADNRADLRRVIFKYCHLFRIAHTRQTLFHSYIMSVIDFSIIMCDSACVSGSTESMTILIRRVAIHRLGDLRGNCRAHRLQSKAAHSKFALSCFAPASFELE